MSESNSFAPFPSTIWSQVVKAGNPDSPEARAASCRFRSARHTGLRSMP